MEKVHKMNQFIRDILLLEPYIIILQILMSYHETNNCWRLLTCVKTHYITLGYLYFIRNFIVFMFTVTFHWIYSVWTAKQIFECEQVTIYLHPFPRLRIL
jgi:hypothetical protein